MSTPSQQNSLNSLCLLRIFFLLIRQDKDGEIGNHAQKNWLLLLIYRKRSFNSTVKLSSSHIILHVKLTGKLPFQLCANFTVKLAEFYLILHVKRNKSKFSSTKGQITRKKC